MKSKRYRKWRYFGLLLISGLIGGLIGYYQEELSFGGSSLTRLPVPAWLYPCATLGLLLVFAAIVAYYLRRVRLFYHQSELQSDEEDALTFEAKAHKSYALASIWTNLLMIPYALTVLEVAYTLHRENMDVWVAGLFIISSLITALAGMRMSAAFTLLYGKQLPAYANTKEKQAFVMEQMDEVEKQVTYEEMYGLVLRLMSQILPVTYGVLVLLAWICQMDVTLAFIIVSVIYLYLIVGQYRIAKRYYQ